MPPSCSSYADPSRLQRSQPPSFLALPRQTGLLCAMRQKSNGRFTRCSGSSPAGAQVWGGIWNVSDSDLASLDRYEGVAGGLYRREITTVMAQNQPVDVHLYIENYDDHGLPHPDYLERIIAGARSFDLPQAWIEDLAAREAA